MNPLKKLSFVFLFALTSLVNAQTPITEVPVHFERGASSAVIKGSVTGYETIDYTLGARAGQTMAVNLETAHGANYFNVLPPGSETALFVGQIDGNEWSGILPQDGTYRVRVYLMRSAARRNEKADFSLEVSIMGTPVSAHDAKVAGTEFHATGLTRCSVGTDAKGSATCDFGVIRHGLNDAEVHISTPGGDKRVLVFKGESVTARDKSLKVSSVKQGDEWEVSVNDFEYFIIPEAIINGG